MAVSRSVAAVAVVAAAATVAAGASLRGTHRLGASGGTLGPDAVPAYYIAATTVPTKTPGSYQRIPAIYATSTGRLLARIPLPTQRGSQDRVYDVSAGADDRTFLFVDEQIPRIRPVVYRFYLARFKPATHQVRVTTIPVRVPSYGALDTAALSPDGTKLAYAHENLASDPRHDLTVFDLKTRQSRTWSVLPANGTGGSFTYLFYYPLSLSWANDNATVAFNWFNFRAENASTLLPNSGVRLLKVAGPGKPGRNLIADSHLALRFTNSAARRYTPATTAGYLSDYAVLAPGGRLIVAGIHTFKPHVCEFASFSARNGNLVRIADRKSCLGLFNPVGGHVGVMWASADGRTLIVNNPPGHPGQIGILRGDHLIVLRVPPHTKFPLAAW